MAACSRAGGRPAGAVRSAARPRRVSHPQRARARAAPRGDPAGADATPAPLLPAAPVGVVVPGFLQGAKDFEPLAQMLTERGLPSVVVPITVAEWLPCLGGRSMRPMLERIEHAVRHAAAGTEPLAVPPPSYGIVDLLADFRDNPGGVLAVGGATDPDEFPADVQPRVSCAPAPPAKRRVVLVGHSAGGWISRVFLSDRAYGGKAYGGKDLVHALVTLGTPHAEAEGVAFANVAWTNAEPLPPSVRCLAVAASGFPGATSGSFTANSYAFCTSGADATQLEGDGVTPVESALAVPGADTLVLEGVTHAPTYPRLVAPELAERIATGTPWYGSDVPMKQWLRWILDG